MRERKRELVDGQHLLNSELFGTKLGMVIHHGKPEGHAKKLGCSLQTQGHRAPNTPTIRSVLSKDSFAVFKVTVKGLTLFLSVLNVPCCLMQMVSLAHLKLLCAGSFSYLYIYIYIYMLFYVWSFC